MKKILKRVRSGDIIAFFDKHHLINEIITNLTKSDVTHVGMVLKKGEKVYCLESHPYDYNKSDIISRISSGGINIVPLEKRLNISRGSIVILQLNKSVKSLKFETKSGKIIDGEQKIWDYYKRNKHKKFDYSLAFSFYSSIGGSNKTKFCSQILAEIYQELGILPKIVPANSISPGIFLEWQKKMHNDDDLKKLKFEKGFKFKKENLNVKNKNEQKIDWFIHKVILYEPNNLKNVY